MSPAEDACEFCEQHSCWGDCIDDLVATVLSLWESDLACDIHVADALDHYFSIVGDRQATKWKDLIIERLITANHGLDTLHA